MIKYYCDRCEKEIEKEQFAISPQICTYKENYPQGGIIKFTMVQSDCKLCVECMRKYIKFLKDGENNG